MVKHHVDIMSMKNLRRMERYKKTKKERIVKNIEREYQRAKSIRDVSDEYILAVMGRLTNVLNSLMEVM